MQVVLTMKTMDIVNGQDKSLTMEQQTVSLTWGVVALSARITMQRQGTLLGEVTNWHVGAGES